MSKPYVQRVLTAAESDPDVMLRFLRVIGMLESPAKLLSPGFAVRVLRAHLPRHRRARALPSTRGEALAAPIGSPAPRRTVG